MTTPITFLSGVEVVDFGLGLSASIVSRMLADMGARIHRIEPAAGDPFYNVYAAYPTWRRGATVSRAGTVEDAVALHADMLTAADICIVGGEEFPGLAWRPAVEALERQYPRLIILDIGSHVHGAGNAATPAVDLLVQAYSGLAHEQYSDRPMIYALPAPSYGAALLGLLGLSAALVGRERTGKGQIVRTSLYEGALSWLGHIWYLSKHSDRSMDLVVPKDVHQLIFRCVDEKYVQFALTTGTARADIYRVLGINDENGAPQRGLPEMAKGSRNFYGDIDLLQSHISKWKRSDLLERLWECNMAAEPVQEPGAGWEDTQVVHNGTIWSEPDGTRRVGLPFTADIHDNSRLPAAPLVDHEAPPLSGLRVIDFGTFAAGPHASMLLAELGADVIKVESPVGDPIHAVYRPYSTSNRGKRNLALDLKKPAGLEIAQRLCRNADIVHHNFRPGVAERLGIDAAALQRIKPSLIVQENSGYGASGPRCRNAGIDYSFQALCGHEVAAGGKGGEPTCYNSTTVDFAAGMLGAIATAAAVYHKIRTGEAATLRTNLLDTGLFLFSELVRSADGSFLPLPTLNAAQTGFHPVEQLYRARDGWVAIAARSEEMARDLLAVLGLETRISKPRSVWGETEAELIATAIELQDSYTLLAKLAAAGVWAAPCREDAREQTLRDGKLVELGTAVRTQHAAYGEILQIGTLLSFSQSGTNSRGETSVLGQQSREILTELGLSDREIDELRQQAVTVL